MSLSDGDFIAVEGKVVDTLLADTGAGGLREEGSPAVNTIMAGEPGLLESFGQSRFPAVLVRAAGKVETPPGPAYSIMKTYKLAAAVAHRGMDREALGDSIRKIASRLEEVLRSQTATDKQFLGLPDLVDGSEGVLVVNVRRTSFAEPLVQLEAVQARAIVEADILVPCAYRYE